MKILKLQRSIYIFLTQQSEYLLKITVGIYIMQKDLKENGEENRDFSKGKKGFQYARVNNIVG